MAYSEGIAPYYDLFQPPRGNAEPARSFVSDFVRAGESLLDIGAGTGNDAIALAAAGVNVTALEPDEEMYAALLVRVAQRFDLAQRITPLPHGWGFDTRGKYDIVTCMAVLHLLGDDEQERVLAFARQQLKPGGLLIFDLRVDCAAREEHDWQKDHACRLGRLLVERHSRLERGPHPQWQTHWRFVSYLDGMQVNEVERTFNWRTVPHQRSHELLEACSFHPLRTHADYAKQRFVPGISRTQVVVAVAR